MDVEGLISTLTSVIERCTLAMYNIGHVGSQEIEALCIAGGSQYSRVMLVSSVVRMEGMFNLYPWNK